MQTFDSVIQNHCRKQGRSVFRGIRSTAWLGESNAFHSISIPMTLCQKREKDCAVCRKTGILSIEKIFSLK